MTHVPKYKCPEHKIEMVQLPDGEFWCSVRGCTHFVKPSPIIIEHTKTGTVIRSHIDFTVKHAN